MGCLKKFPKVKVCGGEMAPLKGMVKKGRFWSNLGRMVGNRYKLCLEIR